MESYWSRGCRSALVGIFVDFIAPFIFVGMVGGLYYMSDAKRVGPNTWIIVLLGCVVAVIWAIYRVFRGGRHRPQDHTIDRPS